jgi:hypothetical protein
MWSPPSSGPAPEHALISLTVLNGLRVCEAAGADIKAPGVGRGHRTLTITPARAAKVPQVGLRLRTRPIRRASTNRNVDAPGHCIGTQLNDLHPDMTAIGIIANCEYLGIRPRVGRGWETFRLRSVIDTGYHITIRIRRSALILWPS